MKRSELVAEIINWNSRFPIDRWWRMKHGVSFMSQQHRESSFLLQLWEFEEDKLFFQQMEKLKNKEEKVDEYIPGSGDFLRSPVTMESFVDEAENEIQEMLKLSENG